ncbi:MAG TPA: ABC transporter substrate-binding protein [Herpetosiphonaceae bacterium]
MKASTYGRWWQFVALLTLLSLVLAACGADTGQPGGSPAASGAATTPAGGEGSPAASGAATTPAGGEQGAAGNGPKLNKDVSGEITFWHFWGSPVRRNAIRRVIAICNQQLPNIKVSETFKPFGDIWTANIAAVAAGSGMPDVIVEDRPQLPQRARDQVDENLQELAARDGIDGSAFWPFTWKQTLYEGNTYGIPYETDVRVLFWNKNAFKEAGLDPEKPPTTWEEVEQYADKLDKKKEDGSYERIAFHPLIKAGTDTFGYTNGVNWISDDSKPQLNTPEAVETVEWVKKWVDRYSGWSELQKFRGSFAAPPQDEFMSGRVAMVTDINGYTSQLDFYRPRLTNAEGKQEELSWGVSFLPYSKERSSTSGGFALSIPRGAPNKDAAWEFIKCATSPEAQASWARDTYAMPANQAAAKDPVLLSDPRWQFFVEAMNHTSGGNYLPQYPNWKEQLEQRYEKIWTGELEAKAALDEAQQAVEAQMKK